MRGPLSFRPLGTATMAANQLRLWFASMAYVLVAELRRRGLQKHWVALTLFLREPGAPLDNNI